MKRKETYALYQKYLKDNDSLSESEKDCLIKGLVQIIQQCYEVSTEPDKIFIYTEQFREKKFKN